MRLLSKVFISLAASVAHGSSPQTASRPLEWLFGESMTTGHRYYIEPAYRKSKLSADHDASYVVNDGIRCIPATQYTRYDQATSIRFAWVTAVGGFGKEHCPVCQREYTVKLDAYDMSDECFVDIEAPTEPSNAEKVRHELNDVCIQTDFRIMKGSTTTVIKDGEYIGEKEGLVKLEVKVQDGKIEHVNAEWASSSERIEELVYFAVGHPRTDQKGNGTSV
ncbi:hypothetical protein FOZ62_013639 [Perkinsus olseni]|uniref:Uncharacterized protein n=2 Tax=Perkinsus olseni TaxID=32597 RepID=A0A7J6T9J8_PEROL|nr:hypothetical protein FOZ62_013639 [Perkinsus olseni]